VSRDVSLYAFEPGSPGVPAGSGTGLFVSSLVNLLRAPTSGLEVRTRWLRHADPNDPARFGEFGRAASWLTGELRRMLGDRSQTLIFIYPKVPVLAHVNEPMMLAIAARTYRMLATRSRLRRQRIVVIVEDLPIELAEGRAKAGSPTPDLPEKQIRQIEQTLFRSAHLLVVPTGFAQPIRDRYEVPNERIRLFRRNVYLPDAYPEPEAPPEFDSGAVNFFYAGAVDSHVAPGFREVLRSIRNAPDTRLHVCGPGRDAVEEWLQELDAPNVRHYGQLSIAEHDWLAARCDIGLILYPTDNPYNHLTPTMKYSSYLANGLAILSTDLRCVAENIREDGVGQAMPIRELALELMRWATRPSLWTDHKARAEEQSAMIRSGAEMSSWVEELATES
jgi:hypothetical protein